MEERIVVALAGQPNTGKSTVFNDLTGGSQYVSNWPGKTCEQSVGVCHHAGVALQIVDLPGTYSLTANSVEEQCARDYIIQAQPDVVVAIMDAAALEHNLYLLAELLQLDAQIVVGLNMTDVAERAGIRIEPRVLEVAVGLPVVPMIATKRQGLSELLDAVVRVAHQREPQTPKRPDIRENHRAIMAQVQQLIAGDVPRLYPPRWVALKLLEGDEEITRLVREQMGSRWESVHAILRQHEDAILDIAGGRYEWIGRMMRAAVERPRSGQVVMTDRIDRLAAHPRWGLLVLFAILGLLFWLTYVVGSPLQTWLDAHIVHGGAALTRTALAGAPAWLVGMLADGVIAGAGTVLTLLPILVIFFAILGLLEDVGYMSRAAYVMDLYMHPMGLHGKSFLPLFLGFGCNVPAVLASRIVESRKARLLTILLTPLMPCTARLAVVAVLAPMFFGAGAPVVAAGVIGVSLGMVALLGVTLHETLLGGEHMAFIMELPLYHVPNLRTIATSVWTRVVDFVKGAGTIILIVSVILWALSTFPGGNIETSYLAGVGRFLSPIGALMGLRWQMLVALLTSFVRKENTIPTLAVLYGASHEGVGLAAALSGAVAPAAALAFLVVQVLFIPCVATTATIQQETRSWRWMLFSMALLLVISFAVGIVVYQGARLVGWGV